MTIQRPEPKGSLESKKRKKPTSSELTRILADNAIVAALYFVLTVALQPLSFGVIQCRISEILTLLCFWRPDFIIGLTVGCFLANVASWTPWDLLFGTLATLLANCLIAYFSHRLLVATLWPILINGVVIGSELKFLEISALPLYLNMIYVAAGEAIAMAAGYMLYLLLKRNKAFWAALKPTRHSDFKW
jgi:uncharacterized membrane protein